MTDSGVRVPRNSTVVFVFNTSLEGAGCDVVQDRETNEAVLSTNIPINIRINNPNASARVVSLAVTHYLSTWPAGFRSEAVGRSTVVASARWSDFSSFENNVINTGLARCIHYFY